MATAQTRSPTFQPSLSAVAASIAASSAFCGLRPVLSVKPWKRGTSATDARKFGAPPLPMRLPFLPRIVPASKIEPSAFATPGCWRTLSSTAAETVGGVPPLLVVSIVLCGVMAASVPRLETVKIVSKALLIESVKTYVPAISVVPRTTASTVSASRSLRASSPRRATLRMLSRPPS